MELKDNSKVPNLKIDKKRLTNSFKYAFEGIV